MSGRLQEIPPMRFGQCFSISVRDNSTRRRCQPPRSGRPAVRLKRHFGPRATGCAEELVAVVEALERRSPAALGRCCEPVVRQWRVLGDDELNLVVERWLVGSVDDQVVDVAGAVGLERAVGAGGSGVEHTRHPGRSDRSQPWAVAPPTGIATHPQPGPASQSRSQRWDHHPANRSRSSGNID